MAKKKNQTWKQRVQNVYSSREELMSLDAIYGLADRCGYDSCCKMWEDNPMIGGSANPQDYGLAE